jgi:DNA-directed RNA polymerase specialized sigma24 family protein
MYFLEGKSSGEIARELKLSRSTVNTQKYLGLAALRKKLMQLFLQSLV